jgi:hypothetical protein
MKLSGKDRKFCRKRLASRPPAAGAPGGCAAGYRRAEKIGLAAHVAHVFEKDGWEAK